MQCDIRRAQHSRGEVAGTYVPFQRGSFTAGHYVRRKSTKLGPRITQNMNTIGGSLYTTQHWTFCGLVCPIAVGVRVRRD